MNKIQPEHMWTAGCLGRGSRQASSEKPGKAERAREGGGQMEADGKESKCQAGLQKPSERLERWARVTPTEMEQGTSNGSTEAKPPRVVLTVCAHTREGCADGQQGTRPLMGSPGWRGRPKGKE